LQLLRSSKSLTIDSKLWREKFCRILKIWWGKMMRSIATIFTCMGLAVSVFAVQPRLQIEAPRGGEYYHFGRQEFPAHFRNGMRFA